MTSTYQASCPCSFSTSSCSSLASMPASGLSLTEVPPVMMWCWLVVMSASLLASLPWLVSDLIQNNCFLLFTLAYTGMPDNNDCSDMGVWWLHQWYSRVGVHTRLWSCLVPSSCWLLRQPRFGWANYYSASFWVNQLEYSFALGDQSPMCLIL